MYAFNSADWQAAFDTLAGTASRDCDQGRVKRGDKIQSFLGLWHLFGYWRAMHDTADTLRYIGADGMVHHIQGSTG